MADGDVKYRFMADAASAERVIAKLEKNYDTLEQKIKSVSRESKKGSKDGEDAADAMAGAIGGLIGKYAGIAGAIGIVTQAWRAWTQEIEAAADAEDKFGRKLTADLALSGDLMRGRQIQQFLQNVPGVTQEAAGAAFFGVRGGAPSLDLQRAQDVATQVAGTQGFTFKDDLEQLTAFGELAGKLAEIAPDKSAQDITDLAAAVTSSAGRNVGALTSQGTIKALGKLTEGGTPLEEALAMAVRGLDVGISAKSLSNLKPEDRALIGDTSALAATFGKAQQDDLSFQQLAAAGELQPDDFVEFAAAGRFQKKMRGFAEERETVGAMFTAAEADAGFIERFGLSTIGRTTEAIGSAGRQALGMDPVPATPQVAETTNDLLREVINVLKQQAQKPLQRNAQVE